jgi:hypothetical protein
MFLEIQVSIGGTPAGPLRPEWRQDFAGAGGCGGTPEGFGVAVPVHRRVRWGNFRLRAVSAVFTENFILRK